MSSSKVMTVLMAVALLAVIAALVLQVFEMRDYGLFARLLGK